MQIHISSDDGVPIYIQIVNQVKHLVAAGRLAPGDEMPPIRVLAEQLLNMDIALRLLIRHLLAMLPPTPEGMKASQEALGQTRWEVFLDRHAEDVARAREALQP